MKRCEEMKMGMREECVSVEVGDGQVVANNIGRHRF